MANQDKKDDSGVLGRLAGRGEDAVTRLMDELGRNSTVTDALARAMSAKGKLDEATRRTLAQAGLNASDEIRELRTRLETLEKRLATLEGSGSSRSTSRTSSGRKASTTTKSSGGTAASRSRSGSGSGSGSKSGGSSGGGSTT